MCKEVGREQIMRERISLSPFNVNSNSLLSFRAVLPDSQTDKAASVWAYQKSAWSCPGNSCRAVADRNFSWTAGGFKTVKISN